MTFARSAMASTPSSLPIAHNAQWCRGAACAGPSPRRNRRGKALRPWRWTRRPSRRTRRRDPARGRRPSAIAERQAPRPRPKGASTPVAAISATVDPWIKFRLTRPRRQQENAGKPAAPRAGCRRAARGMSSRRAMEDKGAPPSRMRRRRCRRKSARRRNTLDRRGGST